jgi:hypothetical protein
MAYKSLVFLTITLFAQDVLAAACCGGGASLPNLITGDFKAQVSVLASNSAVTHSIDKEGGFNKRNNDSREVSESMTIMSAYQLDDLWQVGLTIPMKKNTYKTESTSESSSGLGDLKLQIAYEFLPEYSYSKWKPRGFIFLQHTFNNAKSTHESKKDHGTDALGKGFNTSSLGISFFKIKKNLDFTFMAEYHQSEQRNFTNQNQNFQVKPGAGYSALLGLGLSPKNGNLRYGMNMVSAIERPTKTNGDIKSTSAGKETLELGLNLGYMLGDNSFVASYTDQSFFGVGKNANATKAISLNIIQFLNL